MTFKHVIQVAVIILSLIGLLTGCEEEQRSSPTVKKADTTQQEITKIRTFLQEGGNLIIIRHAQKFEEGSDAPEARSAFDAADASLRVPITVPEQFQNGTGMCLTQIGKATAWLQGEVFRRSDFKVGKVLASPTCRTRQHAEIMFNGNFETEPNLIFGGITLANRVKQTHEAKKALFEGADLKNNLVVIGHGKTAYEAGLVDFYPAQAEILIFRRDNNKSLKLIGHLDTKLLVHMLEEYNF